MTETVLDLPLPTPVQPNPPPRPTRRSDAVIRATVEAMLPDIIEWLGADWRENERARVVDQLIDVIRCASDGYERAKRLEDRHSWLCDSALVEILEAYDGVTEEWKAVKAWVEANGIAPRFGIGDRVRFTSWGRGEEDGVIVNVDPDRAWYVVQTDLFLIENPSQRGLKGGNCIPFEDCRAGIAEVVG